VSTRAKAVEEREGIVGKRTRPFDERHDKAGKRPGNRPVEQQERASSGESSRRSGIAITGEGAADFLTAPGGLDVPESSASKGMAQTRGEGPLSDAKRLVPRLGPDTEAHPGERAPDENMRGSTTGTIGGGGPDAHNKSPVRATDQDDPTVSEDRDSD
jgi:hypothetical protein